MLDCIMLEGMHPFTLGACPGTHKSASRVVLRLRVQRRALGRRDLRYFDHRRRQAVTVNQASESHKTPDAFLSTLVPVQYPPTKKEICFSGDVFW